MPKKTQRNAFYFYMQEQVAPRMRKEGQFTGMESVVQVAHPMWKALPPQEKARYENMAKEYKARLRGQEGDKYRLDNIGNVIADRKNPFDEAKKRKQREKLEFTQRWPEGHEVINEKFYFIDFQTLCKTEEGDYLPVEMGLVEFTMKDGIRKTYHTFIDPGPIPLGYRFECQRTSDDTHKIPVAGFQFAESNYRSIWIQLENFVNPGGENSYYPPIFCAEEKIEEVEYCMGWIHSHACLGVPNRLKKISHLETMVQELFKHIGEPPPSEVALHDLLTASVFDYETGVMCSYHEEVESKFCSMGRVRIYSYSLADAMCALYEIELTSKHLPSRSTEPVCSVIRPQREPEANTRNLQQRGNNGRGMGRNQNKDNTGNFAARDFRETDSSWQPAPVPKTSAWGKKQGDGPVWHRKSSKETPVWGPEEEEERFEEAEPQLSQSLRKPKNPGIAAQMGRGFKVAQPQQHAPPKALGEYGTLIPKAAEVDVGHKVEKPFQHPVLAPGSILLADGQKPPPPKSKEDEWPSLGGPGPAGDWPSLGDPAPARVAPRMAQPAAKPKFAGRAGPPPPQQAPQPPTGWSNGQGLSSMQDIANSLDSSQPGAVPKNPWGALPNNMPLAGIGRGRGAWSSTVGRLPPGMAQPTVLPKST
ncbi:protein maelstrom homolog [Lineus longissimus]|uniref:protein maelstrom homolog n=1 Tax=Lineus longissimus TaxID=88925 RepID=UPI002B4EFF4A